MNKMKLEVDFYADGFRSGVIEVPQSIEVYNDDKRRMYIAEKLVEHLPNDRDWKLSINWLDARNYNIIVIIRARKINEN